MGLVRYNATVGTSEGDYRLVVIPDIRFQLMSLPNRIGRIESRFTSSSGAALLCTPSHVLFARRESTGDRQARHADAVAFRTNPIDDERNEN